MDAEPMAGPVRQTTEVSLTAFVKTLRRDVDRFEVDWIKNHTKDRKAWPAEMGAGDWYEQFLTFMSGEGASDD